MTAGPGRFQPEFATDGTPGSGTRVAVIGGGAVGLTAAGDLAAAGAEVTVFERDSVTPFPTDRGDASSQRAAGVLYDAYVDSLDAKIAARALTRFRSLADATPEFELHECPYVMLVREGDRSGIEALRRSADRMRDSGRDVRTVEGDSLTGRFPSLVADDVALGAVAMNAGWTTTGDYMTAVADRAERLGVRIAEGETATVRTSPLGVCCSGRSNEAYDAVLVAAGAHTGRVLSKAGYPVPVKPYRVQALVSEQAYDGPMCYDASAGFYFRPHPVGLLAGDGTQPREADPTDWVREADEWFLTEMATGLSARTAGTPDVTDSWAGLCTATADGDPLLGELAPGLYVATGWQGHGFMRAPATAELVAAEILGERPPIEDFDPQRFDGEQDFRIREGMRLDPE